MSPRTRPILEAMVEKAVFSGQYRSIEGLKYVCGVGRSIFDKMVEPFQEELGVHVTLLLDAIEGVGGPIQPIGITWEAAGVNDEGWNAVPGCIHTAVDRDVLPGCLLLLIDMFPSSLAQDLLPGPRLVSKASLITIIEEMWLVLQLVLHMKGLVQFEECLNGLRCSTMDSGSVQGICHP